MFFTPYSVDDRADALDAILQLPDSADKIEKIQAFIGEEYDLLMKLTPPKHRSAALDRATRVFNSLTLNTVLPELHLFEIAI